MISTTYQYLFSFPSHSCAARRHETFMPRPTLNLRRLPPANLHISALARHELLQLLVCAPSRSGGSMACRPASVTGRPADWCQVHLRNESATGDTMSATSGDGGGEAVRSRYATRRLLSPGGDRSSSLPKGPQLKFPAQRTTTQVPCPKDHNTRTAQLFLRKPGTARRWQLILCSHNPESRLQWEDMRVRTNIISMRLFTTSTVEFANVKQSTVIEPNTDVFADFWIDYLDRVYRWSGWRAAWPVSTLLRRSVSS